jgi:hypothetical protein
MERGIYHRILEILLAELESPKEEITDPRKFFAEEAKKSWTNIVSAWVGFLMCLGTRFSTMQKETWLASEKSIL